MTDHFTDELFAPFGRMVQVRYPVSRLVLDPERFVDDDQEVMAGRGMGVIYTRTAHGAVLREPVAGEQKAELVARFYEPHHAALEEAVERGLSESGTCLIVDCHSFPSTPLPYELDQEPDRPDICLGTDPFHTPAWLLDAVRSEFEKAGMSVAVNRPFAGTLVPMRHCHRVPDVLSIMVELNRALYMDEVSGERGDGFEKTRAVVSGVLGCL